jgi:dCTP deaminase
VIASAALLRKLRPFDPFCEPGRAFGRSYGLSHAGYDVRLDQDIFLWPKGFRLASTLERFAMPIDHIGIIHDKSTNIRLGIAVHNTVAENGWTGFLTLEISNQGWSPRYLRAGTPIAQVVFHRVGFPLFTRLRIALARRFPRIFSMPAVGYAGKKYQNQRRGPVKAILEAE